MIPTELKEGAAMMLVTRLGEDILALGIANESLENSGIMLQSPGLLRLYEIITSDLAALAKEMETVLE